MTVAKKKGPGRPKKAETVLKDTIVAAAKKQTLNDLLTYEQKKQIADANHAMANVCLAFMQMEYPTQDQMIKLNDAWRAMRNDLYERVWTYPS